MRQNKTIAEIMISLSDEELIEMLPYIRDEDGERVSLIGLRHLLRETVQERERSVFPGAEGKAAEDTVN